MSINELTGSVVTACIKIHSKVGPGCFEKVYEEILYYELTKIGLYVQRQVLSAIDYETQHIEKAYKLALIVENTLVIEWKSLTPLHAVYFKQIKTQLSLLNLKHGMLLNFKVELMKHGIYRIFNNFGREKLTD
ncbi:MAG: GxxExxY protein [Chitinophagaceae bacterium]